MPPRPPRRSEDAAPRQQPRPPRRKGSAKPPRPPRRSEDAAPRQQPRPPRRKGSAKRLIPLNAPSASTGRAIPRSCRAGTRSAPNAPRPWRARSLSWGSRGRGAIASPGAPSAASRSAELSGSFDPYTSDLRFVGILSPSIRKYIFTENTARTRRHMEILEDLIERIIRLITGVE